MPRKKKPIPQGGLFTIFGITINFNAIFTAVITSITWFLISSIASTINTNSAYIRAIPVMQKDIRLIKKEQARVKKEYVPPVAPVTPTPSEDEDKNPP